MAKVYISSTYQDLKECREKVRLVLRRMGHDDIAMEYYVAEERRPVDKCLEDVAACDLYLGIFAWRYGYAPRDENPEGLSITEMEYRQALRAGKECLVFMQDGESPWPPVFIDDDKSRIKRLRGELSAAHLVGLFGSAEDLGRLVAEAINRWEKQRGLLPRRESAPGLDFAAYFDAVRRRYQRLDLDALTPPQREEYLQLQLRSIFVEQSVREEPPPVELPKEMWEKLRREGEELPHELPSGLAPEDVLRARELYYEKPTRPALDALTDPRHRHSLILGDPGSGKSTLARYVLLSLISETGDEKLRRAFDGHVPLLIELRSYAGLYAQAKETSFLDFVEHLSRNEGWGLGPDALDDYLRRDGRAVVIFDGLDEIFDPADRETVARRIAGFARTYPEARVIVTSRVVGYRRRVLADAGFSHFTLQDLDERQVAAFADRWYSLALSDRPDEARARRERILRSFKESASIRQLAGNPMLLTIMAIIGKHQELPRERWKLYDHAASVLIQHWDVNKHLRDREFDAAFIGEEDKKELLRRLAFKMQGGEGGLAGNYIHREQLEEEFAGYLRDRYAQPPDRAKIIATAMINQFRERNFILSLYGASVYGFVHRAFLEFFCASAFVHQFEKSRQLTLDGLKKVYAAHWKDRSWHEVLRLICGMIDEKFAGQLIDHLTGEVDRPRPGRLLQRDQPWNLALAARCLGEVRDISMVAEPAERLLEAIQWLFDRPAARQLSLWNFVGEQILPAAEAIGPNWPGRASLVGWVRRFESSVPEHRLGHVSLSRQRGRFVGIVGDGLDELYATVLSLASHALSMHRVVALYALSRGWRDQPQTLQTVRELIRSDPSTFVRVEAVNVLAGHFETDPGTQPLLRELGVNDEHVEVQLAALWGLAEHFGDDAGTLPLLHQAAIDDESLGVRAIVLRALATFFRYEPQTLPLLLDSATAAPDDRLRAGLMTQLIENYRDEPQTFALLLDRAANDKSPGADASENDFPLGVRETAIEALVEHWGSRPETMALLRERAENDPTPWLRERAKDLAEKLEEKARRG